MTIFDLYKKDNNHPIFSGFTTALMQAYSMADIGNKAILRKAFPEYFEQELEQKFLKDLLELSCTN